MPYTVPNPSNFRINGYRLDAQPTEHFLNVPPVVDSNGFGQSVREGAYSLVWRIGRANRVQVDEWFRMFPSETFLKYVTVQTLAERGAQYSWRSFYGLMNYPVVVGGDIGRWHLGLTIEFNDLIPSVAATETLTFPG